MLCANLRKAWIDRAGTLNFPSLGYNELLGSGGNAVRAGSRAIC
jgi:hypothetical protein